MFQLLYRYYFTSKFLFSCQLVISNYWYYNQVITKWLLFNCQWAVSIGMWAVIAITIKFLCSH